MSPSSCGPSSDIQPLIVTVVVVKVDTVDTAVLVGCTVFVDVTTVVDVGFGKVIVSVFFAVFRIEEQYVE